MKKLLSMALCLVMVLTLVACAREDIDKDTDNRLPTDNQPNTAPNNNNGANNGTNTGPVDDKKNNTVTPGENSTLPNDDTNGTRTRRNVTSPNVGGYFGNDYLAAETATWEQMLDNGRVRDTDGFLQDGENASWR